MSSNESFGPQNATPWIGPVLTLVASLINLYRDWRQRRVAGVPRQRKSRKT